MTPAARLARRDERARQRLARDADAAARRELRARQKRLKSIRPFVAYLDRSGCHDAATGTWRAAADNGERLAALTPEQRAALLDATLAITSLTKTQARGRDAYAAMLQEPQGPVN
jgi:hypothetical protein